MDLPNQTTTSNFQKHLDQLVKQQTEQLTAEFPGESKLVMAAINERVLAAPAPSSADNSPHPGANSTLEEQSALFAKIAELATSAQQTVNQQDALYLEQQISDVINLDVSTKNRELSLQSFVGKIKSLPHVKSKPTIKDEQINSVPEAGLAIHRSRFGWLNNDHQIDQFGLAISSSVLGESLSHSLIDKLKLKKVLVINPTDAKIMIAHIVDFFEYSNPTYLCGGTPALIREGMFWSPENAGKCLLFLLSDDDPSIETGLINFTS